MDLQLLYKAKSGDENARNNFIEINKKFIHKYACTVCKRYLTWENDDELSIALLAFNKAIDSFQEGEFEYYSKMVMKHRLIDHFRKNSSNDVPIEDTVIQNTLQYESNIDEKLDRAAQIRVFKDVLDQFNINMADLTSNSPKHKDTRKRLMDLALDISSRNEIVSQLLKNKLLPIKDILQFADVSRKLLEEWRKYIIALIIIFSDRRLESIKDFIM
jgi:RNA polymerase sigma factor